MAGKIRYILLIAALFIGINTSVALGEEGIIEQGGAVPDMRSDADTLWLWGEVVSIDIEKTQLLIKYLDYEADQEKEITITIDPKTTYENIKSFTEIKPKDTVSIDYVVEPGDRNIARNISVEKPEELEALGEGTTPENSAASTDEDIEAQLDRMEKQEKQ